MPRCLVLLLLACHVSSAVAQVDTPPVRAELLQPHYAHAVWTAVPADPLQNPAREPLGGFLGPGDEDHRYPGFFIGAGLGLFVTALSVSWCSDTDNSCSQSQALLMGTMFTAMTGFGGAMLGGLIPKDAVNPRSAELPWEE